MTLDWQTVTGTVRRGSAPVTRRAAAAYRRLSGWSSREGQAIERARWHLAAGRIAHATAAAHRASGSIAGRDFLIGLLDYQGETERALAMCVDNAASHIQRLRQRRLRPQRYRELGPDQRVFLSGFFKSGSSAVLDYLRGFAGTARWAPAGELRLIKSVGGMARFTNAYVTHGAVSPADLVAFYLHITGAKHTTSRRGHYDKWRIVNRNSAALFLPPPGGRGLPGGVPGVLPGPGGAGRPAVAGRGRRPGAVPAGASPARAGRRRHRHRG